MSVYSQGDGEESWQHWSCFEDDGDFACGDLWLTKHQRKVLVYSILN